MVKVAQAKPRKFEEAKYLIEKARAARKKLDLFARFRRLIGSTIRRDMPPGVRVK